MEDMNRLQGLSKSSEWVHHPGIKRQAPLCARKRENRDHRKKQQKRVRRFDIILNAANG
jgi:hypothetical protein